MNSKKLESAYRRTGWHARMTHTPTHTHTHINHVCRWVGNVTAFPLAQLVHLCCVCLYEIWPAPSLSRSLPPRPPLPFTLLCLLIGGDVELRGLRCAYSTVVRVRLSHATCARCMCRGERCPTDTHFMQSRRAWCGGGDERLEDGAHGQ